jgi:hypothetical protein
MEQIDPKHREGLSRKKLSSAASNVAQAKTRIAQRGKVESLSQTRVEYGVDAKTGEPILTAMFPHKGADEAQHVDMTFLLAFPNLQPMFTEAFLRWGSNRSPGTRETMKITLRRCFFGYIKKEWSDALSPEDIDDELLAGFKESLLSKQGGRVESLHPSTVRQGLGALRSIMDALDTGPWADAARYIAERVPSVMSGAARKSTPTEVLGIEHLLSILDAAEREVLALERRYIERDVLVAEGRTRWLEPGRVKKNDRSDYFDLGVCLAALDAAYPGTIPDLSEIRAANPALGGAVQQIHGQGKVCSYFYPCARDLVPFVLLLSVATVFNPDTVLCLDWADIAYDKDRAGIPAIEIVGTKGRASRDLVRLLDPNTTVSSQLSLQRMLGCLREITSRIRSDLVPEHADRLFVFVQRVCAKSPKGYGLNGQRIQRPSGDISWTNSLSNFIKNNKLPQFTLGQLRPSILDLVQFMDGSLEAARKVGNHGSPVTTWTHYTSGGVRQRYREKIGQVVVLRERWLETGGTIDPRRLMPRQDKGAATPGFSCLDPFDSQRPNQQRGRLCKDYGGCPSCPMAAAHPNDPLCVAYYLALEVAIYRSQAAMSARTWLERWAPVLADLKALRAWIPPDVLAASRMISIQLPNVG